MKIEGNTAQIPLQTSPKPEYNKQKVDKSSMISQQEIKKAWHEKTEKKENEEQQKLKKDELKQIVKGLNEFLKPKYTSLNFKLHDDLNRYYVEVVDQETKKVIREIPEKELLDMYAKMTEFLGLFIDRKL